ncbi:MAG: type II toxin-antitoxin system VapC family toxin [Chloroflexota bacterium]|nr:type II toxin-antitoxin system VapC family toxin [Chloroflexota bacterium]
MNSWIVIDSGVYIASVVEETHTEKADSLLAWIEEQAMRIAAPTLLRYEVAATLRKLAHRGSITPGDSARMLTQILGNAIDLVIDDRLITRAYELATEHGLPSAYDAQYLALAERLDCALWTFDKRLFNTVRERLHRVYYVPDFVTPSPQNEA